MKKDVIIIGAGASGMMCAIEAGKRKRPVLVLDHAEKIGKKIFVSGGGRCNFTNINAGHENYFSHNPDFCKSALARFTPQDFIDMVKSHGIRHYEKDKGRMFCEDSSRDIVSMLQRECNEAGVEIRLNCHITGIEKEGSFKLSTDHGMLESVSLVIATGGLSYPDIGATDIGYRIAKQFGLEIAPLKPALVPLTFAQKDLSIFRALSGVSIETIVSCGNRNFRGNILFTHMGLSGPAILQASLYWNKGDDISINLLPDVDAYGLFMERKQGRVEMRNLLSEFFPRRFSQRWCETSFESKPVYQYTNREFKAIAHKIHNWIIKPTGSKGYKEAEVTLGGIDTDELSSKTMESKKVRGLYFIGEVVDVTGQLGGYNLQWAWSSGYAAGQYV